LISTSRQVVKLDLLSYGEDELAARVRNLTDDELLKIGERAFQLTFAAAKGKLYLAVALAAVEVMEGTPRSLRLTRRKLKGIWYERAQDEMDPHMTRMARKPAGDQANPAP
jgi:hypothetical protein